MAKRAHLWRLQPCGNKLPLDKSSVLIFLAKGVLRGAASSGIHGTKFHTASGNTARNFGAARHEAATPLEISEQRGTKRQHRSKFRSCAARSGKLICF
ncbi:hypothetical protein BV898_01589 [Hypsibius exemplaris]|uniref:Uncharacterized protein n=1 Tax=Hypsibius exemplaris TaxID=2072580 RepID=A0A1W0XAV3_HYPEX|nr:hypothetical protein BV898_01589 [Hypsibius exemplaris]